MPDRIEITFKVNDTRAEVLKKKLNSLGFTKITDICLVDVYTLDMKLDATQLEAVASMLTNPILQTAKINMSQIPKQFTWAIEIGFLPGVTDNVANTTKQGIEDLLKNSLAPEEGVYTSQIVFLSGMLTREEVHMIAESMANPLIQRIRIKSIEEFLKDNGMGIVVPKVRLDIKPNVDLVDIMNAKDEELAIIGKQGIVNKDGSRRGPLALDVTYMKAIQAYFRKEGRNPTDVELESIAQTWSEHCKHTIFADPMDEIKDGLYRTCIKAATAKIREEKKKNRKSDFCISVFTDNSGAIEFDRKYLITNKIETHNSPSALDPFGGAITGIVGVNRDAIGFGLGAKPVVNIYGYCFADPNDKKPLYKGTNLTQKMLLPRAIMDGVVAGVNAGGNQSGIPTPQGFVFFEERYKGKPLVFVGTVGLIPKKSKGRLSHIKVTGDPVTTVRKFMEFTYIKKAMDGDYIVMVGGKVGKDGIHGATFSSEAMDAGSPATAVQIGDPITQKKLSDAIVKEARDLKLYNSITDNGAGGISCSVAEMARECGGCEVQLDKVPLKYPGLAPWEIWISESQERMTLSVPKNKWDKFNKLMEQRGVEATVIGKFTNSGRCVVEYNKQKIMDVDMDFLHDGLPPREIKTTYTKQKHEEPVFHPPTDLTESLLSMLSRPNIASYEFISKQYDHEVQAGSVIKPLQGRGRINGDASVTRPVLTSKKAIVCSQGLNPTYSDIDTYHMAACAIDTAIRNAVTAGADPDYIALMDNFCWCSSNESERLGQLKAAVKACYDYSVTYGTPFISGKDSMFNDFKGYDENGNPVKISVPPTLLISSIGVIDDAAKAISIDVKFAGDLVYILGETNEENGASEYFAMIGERKKGKRYVGNAIPQVNAAKNRSLYYSLYKAIKGGIIASAQSVHRGGLAVALAKSAMAGMSGMEVSLVGLLGNVSRNDFALYSESQGRVVVTIAPKNKKKFERIMNGNAYALVGTVRTDSVFIINGKNGKQIVRSDIETMLNRYKSTFMGY